MNPVHTLSHPNCLRSHSILSSHLRLGVQSCLFHTKILYVFIFSLIRATCTTLTIFTDLTTLTIFREEYKLWNPSLKKHLQIPVAAFPLGSIYIFLCNLLSRNLILCTVDKCYNNYAAYRWLCQGHSRSVAVLGVVHVGGIP
jgi:uncharacterized membrane protein